MENYGNDLKGQIKILLKSANDIISKQKDYKEELKDHYEGSTHNHYAYNYMTGFTDCIKLEYTGECEVTINNRISNATNGLDISEIDTQIDHDKDLMEEQIIRKSYLDGFSDAVILSKIANILYGTGALLEDLEEIQNVKENLH